MTTTVSYGGGAINDTHHYTVTDIYGGVVLHETPNQVTRYRWYNHQGNTTPNFHARKKRGDLLPYTGWYQFDATGQAQSWYTITDPNGAVWQSLDMRRNYYTDWYLTPVRVQDLFNTAYKGDLRALTQDAAAKIYSRGWDTGTFLAEIAKARKMFLNLVQRTYRSIKRGDAADIWLQDRYGLRLALYDIADVVDVINGLGKQSRRLFTDRVGYSMTETYTQNVNGLGLNHPQLKVVDVIEYGVRGSVAAVIEPPKFQFNPVITAWEVIPWSFVIDWMVDVGRFLEALMFVTFAQDHTACYGYKVKATRTVETVGSYFASGYSGSISFSSKCESTLTERVPTSIPLHPLVETQPLSAYKVMDLLYLIMGVLRRK